MGARKLAEAIILQSLEDLYDSRHRAESIDFFTGVGFEICSGMAGLDVEARLKLMGMVKKAASQNQRRTRILGPRSAGKFNHILAP